MDLKIDNSDIPQWKKDLIARLRNQNKAVAATSSSSSDSQHPASSSVSSVHSRQANDEHSVNSSQCSPVKKIKMVQERVWSDIKTETFSEMMNENYHNNGYRKDSASESDEDLHYGPGIVKKLKNRYLSLALRESNNRPSILHMRKATSLEHLLDDDVSNKDNVENRQYQSKANGFDNSNLKNLPNRYLRRQGRVEMKRARSVEAISQFDSHTTPVITTANNRQSLHEDMLISIKTPGSDFLIKKPNDKLLSTNEQNVSNNNYGYRINRPKRIQPIMNEKEKPPADFVKQAKLIFERRPDQRTKKPPLTGEVAAKVGSFNNIIVKAKAEAKVSKKPPIKHVKPAVSEKGKIVTRPVAKPVIVSKEIMKTVPPKSLDIKKEPSKDVPLASPIPDVSRIDFTNKNENDHNLSETPDLILTSSPLSNNSPNHKKISENFLREEIRNTSPIISSPKDILENSSMKSASPTFLENKTPSPTKKIMSPVLHSPAIKTSPILHSPTRKTIGSPQWNHSPTKKDFPINSPTNKTPGSPVWSSPWEFSPTKKITSPLLSPNRVKPASPLLSPSYNKSNSPIGATKSYTPPVQTEPELNKVSPRPSVDSDIHSEYDEEDGLESPGYKMVPPSSLNNISQQSNSSVFNFTHKSVNQGHLPVNKNVSNAKVPPSKPLQIDVNVNGHVENKSQAQESTKLLQESKTERPRSPPRFSFPSPPKTEKPSTENTISSEKVLTTAEIEKNLLNTVKTLQQPSVNVNVSVEVVNTSLVPKKLKPREQNSNTAVFDFRSRKDVPDYISNDKSRTLTTPELPRVSIHR